VRRSGTTGDDPCRRAPGSAGESAAGPRRVSSRAIDSQAGSGALDGFRAKARRVDRCRFSNELTCRSLRTRASIGCITALDEKLVRRAKMRLWHVPLGRMIRAHCAPTSPCIQKELSMTTPCCTDSWLTRVSNVWRSICNSLPRKAVRRRFRLNLEALECRCMLSATLLQDTFHTNVNPAGGWVERRESRANQVSKRHEVFMI
jgi:hypothetical protein